MKVVGILLLIVGIVGLVLGGMMYGDIAVAACIGALSSLLSGIGFLALGKKVKA